MDNPETRSIDISVPINIRYHVSEKYEYILNNHQNVQTENKEGVQDDKEHELIKLDDHNFNKEKSENQTTEQQNSTTESVSNKTNKIFGMFPRPNFNSIGLGKYFGDGKKVSDEKMITDCNKKRNFDSISDENDYKQDKKKQKT